MVSLYVAIPCYGCQMHAHCTLSLLELERECQKNDITMELNMIGNESLITRARNSLVHDFLETSFTHLLFIDSDIQFDAKDIIKMIEADKDIIGGIYARKGLLWDKIATNVKKGKPIENLKYNTSDYVFHPKNIDEFNQSKYKLNHPVEVKYIGTGLMLIKREVFNKIKETFPLNTYNHNNNKYHNFFECGIVNEEFLSEDYFFCNTWKELGGQIFAALWVKSVHYGNLGLHTDFSRV